MPKYGFLITFLTFFNFLSAQKNVVDTISLSDQPKIELPKKLDETSGLIYTDGNLWTFNDSGGKSEIYKIDSKTGEILQTVKLKNAENIDWEDITADEKHIYIGDFGNNNGDRRDLKIYVVKKKDIKPNDDKQKVTAKIINFNYPEQTDFTSKNKHTTNFDCEAMVFYNNKLHIFTKEWTNLQTTHYTLDIKTEIQKAKKIETFNTAFCVTAACIVTINHTKNIYFTGYTPQGFVYLSKINDIANDLFFINPLRLKKYFLGLSLSAGQVEGLTASDKELLISSESFDFAGFHVPQTLYHLPF